MQNPTQPTSWRTVLGLALLLGPELLLAYVFLTRLFPNVLLGRGFTVFVDIALALGGAGAVLWLLRKPCWERWLVGRWQRWSISGLAVMGWFLVPTGFMLMQMRLGTPLRYPTECEGWSSLVIERCEGRDFSLMQGRYSYRRGRGRVRGKLCERLRRAQPEMDSSEPSSESPCQFEDTQGWQVQRCEPYGLASDWSCYRCGFVSSGSDEYRELQAFDSGCSRGIAYAAVGEKLEEVPAKLDSFSSVGDGWMSRDIQTGR